MVSHSTKKFKKVYTITEKIKLLRRELNRINKEQQELLLEVQTTDYKSAKKFKKDYVDTIQLYEELIVWYKRLRSKSKKATFSQQVVNIRDLVYQKFNETSEPIFTKEEKKKILITLDRMMVYCLNSQRYMYLAEQLLDLEETSALHRRLGTNARNVLSGKEDYELTYKLDFIREVKNSIYYSAYILDGKILDIENRVNRSNRWKKKY